jgi:D-glycero-alpha-D-manno-heptose 1-phosphate guanylyltransferase
MEVIILAGGLGTRLKSEVKSVPKSMALINSKPFLEYLLDQLIKTGVQRVILSVGYKSEVIQDHFHDKYKNCELVYAVESTQLGTGGAIKNAMPLVQSQDVIVVNGDSIFVVDLQAQLHAHLTANADVTLALKPMKNIERYGTVDLDQQDRIIRFNEKQPLKEGLINTGTYIFNVKTFQALSLPDKFSIEKEFFETHIKQLNFLGFSSHGYFLDIGIPADFKKAQYEFEQLSGA